MTLRPANLKSWSSSLRLPKSKFPPRPLPRSKYLQKCSDDLYTWQSRERADQKPFVLHDGPPYANGSLHIGHALNKILKDMICRVKVQQGHRVVFTPGWDCHGLPIEIKALEKERAKNKDGVLDAVGVRRAARSLATNTVKNQMKEFREWGIMADWEKSWKTMDKTFEARQLDVFKQMVTKGMIFRRYKPVYWSPSSQTALAEAELEYKDDHISTAAYIKFPLATLPNRLSRLHGLSNVMALIWTTTPWTLPANRAIAFSRDLEYVLVRYGNEHLIIAKSRLASLQESCFQGDPVEVVDTFLGAELDGTLFTNDLRGAEAASQPMFHADFVSADSGTGLVHLAPGHGMDDYEVCTRLGIEAAAPVDDLGRFTAAALPGNPSVLEGKSVLDDGGKEVLKILGDKVLFVHQYKHKYPYDWRTKLPVIVRATEQWFADVGQVKDAALERLTDVQFIPQAGKQRLESFVKGRSEWCISRQRAWGVPIPALYDERGFAVLDEASVTHIIKVINDRGIDAWWTDPADDPAWVLPGLEGTLRRGRDTMDVWFDSGTSWTQTQYDYGAADVYCEGTDQHRGWFQSSLLTHTSVIEGSAPFKTLITHGFTLDQQGKKMSKSIGNVVAPSQIMDGSLLPPSKKGGGGLGIDALRLWVASSDYTKDVVIGQPVLASINASIFKYRLTLKMLLGTMHQEARTAPKTKLDMIALAQLHAVTAEVQAAYDKYEFYKAVNLINRWIFTDLSAFYFEAIKDRLYCGDAGGVMEEIFHGLLKMLTPITPTLVEEAWDHLPGWMASEYTSNVLAHPFHQTVKNVDSGKDAALLKDAQILSSTITAIRAAQEEARSQKLIGSSLECSVVLHLPEGARPLFEQYADELDTIFIVSSVQLGGTVHGAWKFSAQFESSWGQVTAWVLPPRDSKCPRCWKYVSEAEDELCKRCDEVVQVQ